MQAINRVNSVLGKLYSSRKVVLVGRPVGEYGEMAKALDQLGAVPPFIVSNSSGVAADVSPVSGVYEVPLGYSDINSLMAMTDALLEAPPDQLRAALDVYDPRHEALVVTESNVMQTWFSGRPVLDGRERSWSIYDGGVGARALWGRLGLPTLPGELVRPSSDELARAYREMDFGTGVTCYGDMRGVVHEPVYCSRRVVDDRTLAETVSWFSLSSDVVLVESSISGVPTSVCGFVLADGVAVLRPYEELLLTSCGSARIRHAGCSSMFSPGTTIREQARDIARTVGLALSDEFGFRGAFCVTGVTNARGFIPSYLSTWLNHGHRHLSGATHGISWPLLNGAIRRLDGFDMPAAELEAALLADIDAAPRITAAIFFTGTRVFGERSLWLGKSGGTPCVLEIGKESAGRLVQLPTQDGAMLVMLGADAWAADAQSAAVVIADAVNLAIGEWNLGIDVFTALAGS